MRSLITKTLDYFDVFSMNQWTTIVLGQSDQSRKMSSKRRCEQFMVIMKATDVCLHDISVGNMEVGRELATL